MAPFLRWVPARQANKEPRGQGFVRQLKRIELARLDDFRQVSDEKRLTMFGEIFHALSCALGDINKAVKHGFEQRRTQ